LVLIGGTMKTTVADTEEPKYPYLGRSQSGATVLFISMGKGLCLVGSIHHAAYTFNTIWDESAFTPFKGSITLSND